MRHRIEQGVVLLLGFIFGAGIANCVAPGDLWLPIIAGVAMAVFCREHFVYTFPGEPKHKKPLPH